MALFNISSKKAFQEKVLDNKKIVLVDFWADWCPPCRAMAPILQQLGDELDKTADIVKVDVEASVDNNQLAIEHGVQGIPNMQIYKNSKVIDEIVGVVPKSVLVDKLS